MTNGEVIEMHTIIGVGWTDTFAKSSMTQRLGFVAPPPVDGTRAGRTTESIIPLQKSTLSGAIKDGTGAAGTNMRT